MTRDDAQTAATPATPGRAGEPIVMTDAGFYCPAGDFHVDPWRPVERAVITHAHADHARPGSAHYLCARRGEGVLRVRMGRGAAIESVPYGETVAVGDARVSFFPAGHLLGSAQVRIDAPAVGGNGTGRRTWVLSGDYTTTPGNPTCDAFEPVACDVFVSECTFGLPVYRWPAPASVFAQIDRWWQANQEAGRTSVLFAYALGKAQRLLAGVDRSIGPIFVHGALRPINEAYRAEGIDLPETPHATVAAAKEARGRALVVAPPSAAGSPWMRKFEPASTAFCSGWMRVRGMRRRRAADRGFVLSDHADWSGLLDAIDATGAERIGLTHGSTDVMARFLRDRGRDVLLFDTRFEAGPDADTDGLATGETVGEAALSDRENDGENGGGGDAASDGAREAHRDDAGDLPSPEAPS